jgi:excisionase family DNA binding protein
MRNQPSPTGDSDPIADDRLLTIKEVSELTGLAVGSLYHLAAEGRIPTTRLSRRCLRFRRSALLRWWDERSAYPAPEHKKQKR